MNVMVLKKSLIKKEEVVCKIADLVKELDCLNELEELIMNNQ